MTTTVSMTAWLYWRTRLEQVLTADQLAIYDAYLERLARMPAIPTAEEQQVLVIIAADRQAAAQEIESERAVGLGRSSGINTPSASYSIAISR